VPEAAEPTDRHPSDPPREPVQRWRLVTRREALDPDHQARAQAVAWEASLAASGLPVAGLDAPGGRPRLALGAPLPPAVPGERELADVWLTARLPSWRVRDCLASNLPEGWTLVDLYDVWLGEPALSGQVVASVYRAALEAGAPEASLALRLRDAVSELLAATTVPRERAKGDRTVAYDLRPFVERLEVARTPDGPATLVMELRHDPEKGMGRPEEVLAELSDRLGVPLPIASIVRERLVLAAERPPVTGEGRRARQKLQRPGLAPRRPSC